MPLLVAAAAAAEAEAAAAAAAALCQISGVDVHSQTWPLAARVSMLFR